MHFLRWRAIRLAGRRLRIGYKSGKSQTAKNAPVCGASLTALLRVRKQRESESDCRRDYRGHQERQTEPRRTITHIPISPREFQIHFLGFLRVLCTFLRVPSCYAFFFSPCPPWFKNLTFRLCGACRSA